MPASVFVESYAVTFVDVVTFAGAADFAAVPVAAVAVVAAASVSAERPLEHPLQKRHRTAGLLVYCPQHRSESRCFALL